MFCLKHFTGANEVAKVRFKKSFVAFVSFCSIVPGEKIIEPFSFRAVKVAKVLFWGAGQWVTSFVALLRPKLSSPGITRFSLREPAIHFTRPTVRKKCGEPACR